MKKSWFLENWITFLTIPFFFSLNVSSYLKMRKRQASVENWNYITVWIVFLLLLLYYSKNLSVKSLLFMIFFLQKRFFPFFFVLFYFHSSWVFHALIKRISSISSKKITIEQLVRSNRHIKPKRTEYTINNWIERRRKKKQRILLLYQTQCEKWPSLWKECCNILKTQNSSNYGNHMENEKFRPDDEIEVEIEICTELKCLFRFHRLSSLLFSSISVYVHRIQVFGSLKLKWDNKAKFTTIKIVHHQFPINK